MARARTKPLRGVEEPRLFTPPLRELTPETTRGYEAIQFAEQILGLTLTPWQKWLFLHALELRPDGRYRFRTLVILIARQNGKTTWLQIMALWCLYMDGAQLVLGTAQNLDVAEECWQGSVDMAESIPELRDEIAAVDRTNGKKALRLQTGQRYKVAAASRRGGRGLSGNLVVLDELREHQTWDAWAAITKTTMARKDALIVGLSNAGDDTSVVLSHLRNLALEDIEKADEDSDSSLGLFEWSAEDGCRMDDPQAWAQANPSLGYTDLSVDAIRAAYETDPEHVFRTEVLCQWVEQANDDTALPIDTWLSLADQGSKALDPVAFGIDVSPEGITCISSAGVRGDGRLHVEIVDHRPGSSWASERIAELSRKWHPSAVVLDVGSPAGALLPDLDRLGITLTKVSGREMAQSSVAFASLVHDRGVFHLDQPALNAAVGAAKRRPLGDLWAFGRRGSFTDISPLIACALAAWGHAQNAGRVPQIIDPWSLEDDTYA